MDTQKVAELIKESVENMGDEGVSFYNGYSGRGMYGRKCVGITGDMQGCMRVVGETLKYVHEVAEEDGMSFDRVVDALMAFMQDSMGRDIIIYWPDIEALAEDAANDE